MRAKPRFIRKFPFVAPCLAAALGLLVLTSSLSQQAEALPAFARKYGLRCSACHEAWPMLNYFGQKFKDNGYQLMNDRDAPIYQNPSYWPATARITPPRSDRPRSAGPAPRTVYGMTRPDLAQRR